MCPPTLTSTPSNLVSEGSRREQISDDIRIEMNDRSRVVSGAVGFAGRAAPQNFATENKEPTSTRSRGAEVSSSQFKGRALERTDVDAGKNPPNLGARPKTSIKKTFYDDVEELTDDDQPSVNNTFESDVSSTRTNIGSRSSLSLNSVIKNVKV